METPALELVRSTARADDRLPPDARVAGTRGRILLAGLELFGGRGYHATSVRDIATGAGLTSPSLYTHFASKEAILAELVMIGHEWHHRVLVNALVSAGGDPTDQLAELVRSHVTVHCRYPLLSRVVTNERQHLGPDASGPSEALRKASWDLVEEVLRRGLEAGQFLVDDATLTQTAISSLGISAGTWFLEQSDYTPEQVGDRYAALALRMAGGRAAD